MALPKLYSTKEAAEYLGIHPQSLKYHMYTMQHIAPDAELAGSLVFTQETLDEFRRKYMDEAGYTMREAAEYLGVSLRWVRYQFHTAKKLKADARRRGEWVFFQSTLDAARAELLPPGDEPTE